MLQNEPLKNIALVAVLLISSGIVLLSQTIILRGRQISLPSQQACTEEAKICPDGSAVGRTGPKCEFAICPEKKVESGASSVDTNGWKTYKNDQYGFEFQYDPNAEIIEPRAHELYIRKGGVEAWAFFTKGFSQFNYKDPISGGNNFFYNNQTKRWQYVGYDSSDTISKHVFGKTNSGNTIYKFDTGDAGTHQSTFVIPDAKTGLVIKIAVSTEGEASPEVYAQTEQFNKNIEQTTIKSIKFTK